MNTWFGDDEPGPARPRGWGWGLVVLRGLPAAGLVLLTMLILAVLRLLDRPLAGRTRALAAAVVQIACRIALGLLGIRLQVRGTPLEGPGAIVANHSSWIDILALNARQRVSFVAKQEVAGWPGIGRLVRLAGTLFIARDRRAAAEQVALFRERLGQGQRLVFFPEGTSTDGQRVLPFKPTLFAAFFDDALREAMQIQPVTVRYHAPAGADPRLYGWWGGMSFDSHLLAVLAQRPQGRITLQYHAAIPVRTASDRKALARMLEVQVRAGLQDRPA